MDIFKHQDYKEFVRTRVAEMPKRGRGQYRKMAEVLDVNSTVISQIFNGDRHLNADQGLKLANFFGLGELETQYMVVMVLKERAGTFSLEKHFDREAARLKREADRIANRIIEHKEITEEHKGLFYSDWIYSGVRMASALPDINTVDDVADYYGVSRARVAPVVKFLLETGLCVEKDGKLAVGPQSTHLSDRSPFINSHRKNWRAKALEKINNSEEMDLFYSGVMTLSKKDRELLREELIQTISKVLRKIQKSEEEEIVCFNLDWFGI